MQNYTEPTFNPFAQNVAIIKSYFKRPLVLAIAILYIIVAVASIAVTFSTSAGISEMYNTLFSIPEVTESMTEQDMKMFELYTNSSYMSISMASSMIPSLIIMALTVVSYFIIYLKSKNENPYATPRAGFTILFILSILELISAIGVSLLMILIVGVMAILSFAMPQELGLAYEDTTVLSITMIFCIIMYVILGAVLLTYAISKLRYLNSVRKGLTTVNISHKGAGIYGVFSIIFAVIGIFSAILIMLFAPIMNAITASLGEPMITEMFSSLGSVFLVSGVVTVLSSVYMLLDGILALGYKKHIKNITDGFDGMNIPQPVYTQPTFTQPNIDTTPLATAQLDAPAFEPEITLETPSTKAEAPSPEQTPAPTPQAICCPQCGASVNKSDIFCNTCGNKIK